jgi:hypothetical protein
MNSHVPANVVDTSENLLEHLTLCMLGVLIKAHEVLQIYRMVVGGSERDFSLGAGRPLVDTTIELDQKMSNGKRE